MPYHFDPLFVGKFVEFARVCRQANSATACHSGKADERLQPGDVQAFVASKGRRNNGNYAIDVKSRHTRSRTNGIQTVNRDKPETPFRTPPDPLFYACQKTNVMPNYRIRGPVYVERIRPSAGGNMAARRRSQPLGSVVDSRATEDHYSCRRRFKVKNEKS